jgi:hypothetical protein
MSKEPTKPEDQDTSAKGMVRLFGSSFAAALASFGLGIVAAAASLPHRLFGQQGFKVWIIEVGADVTALTATGAILAVMV